MKPGPATSTFSTSGEAGMWEATASAILAGAMRASRADRRATVEVHSPWEVSAGRSTPASVTSKAGRSPAAWAAATAWRTSSSMVSGMGEVLSHSG